MARYEHLPIYKAALDMAVYVERIAMNFSKCHKYTLGSELRSLSHRIVRKRVIGNLRGKIRIRAVDKAVWASYMGHFKHAQSRRLVTSLMAKLHARPAYLNSGIK